MIDKPVEGVVTDARSHPAGARGAKLSLVEVAERAWKARMSPRLRAWVTQVLAAAGVSTGGRRQKAQAILNAFRKKVPYIADPVMGEFMATPDQLLCLDEGGLCIIGGDCFPGGTLLLRKDGPTRIQDVKIDDMIWGRDTWSYVARKINKGRLDIDKIVLGNGSEVPLTSDHHVFVQRSDNPNDGTTERMSVAELTEGEYLIQPKIDPFDMNWNAPAGRATIMRGREAMRVRRIDRAVDNVPCWDITTSDGYVYLPEHDVTVSNCDEASITLAAAMLCIGIPVMIVGSSHRHPHHIPTHVFMAFQDELENWVRMDGTTQHPVGQTAHHAREWWVEPGKEQKDSGVGDFVGMVEKHVGVNAPPSNVGLGYPGIR